MVQIGFISSKIVDIKQLHYVNSKKNKNTIRGIDSNKRKFELYLKKKGENRDMLTLRPALLDQYIAGWLLDYRIMKKIDGIKQLCEPEPGTLTTYFRSLCSYFTMNSYPLDIARDKVQFKTCNNVLESRKKDLTSQGKGKLPNKAKLITEEEEESMWVTGAFGDDNPKSLLHTVYYQVSMNLGFRGNHEQRQLCVGDFKKVKYQS